VEIWGGIGRGTGDCSAACSGVGRGTATPFDILSFLSRTPRSVGLYSISGSQSSSASTSSVPPRSGVAAGVPSPCPWKDRPRRMSDGNEGTPAKGQSPRPLRDGGAACGFEGKRRPWLEGPEYCAYGVAWRPHAAIEAALVEARRGVRSDEGRERSGPKRAASTYVRASEARVSVPHLPTFR
jgi:hypothetical protein